MSRFPSQTALTIATSVVVLAVVHMRAGSTKGLDPNAYKPLLELRGYDVPPPPPVRISLAEPGIAAQTQLFAAPLLEDKSGALDHFYDALWNLQKGTAAGNVSILHYGDSPTTADLITGDVRELLQQRFGDAGDGFVLIAKPWAWYQHHGVSISDSGWKIRTAVGTMREGNYGLGGAIFEGSAGAYSRIRMEHRSQTSVEVAFMEGPGGGTMVVKADGDELGSINSDADVPQIAFQTFQLPPNTGTVEIRPTQGTVRLFGVVLEKSRPGLAYHSLGLNGASITVLSRAFNFDSWSRQLRHLNPDLVILNYGTNESGFSAFVDKQFETELHRAINRIRQALPQTSILVMSPMDRGERTAGNVIRTMPTIPRIVQIEKRVAADTGCAFFNTYEAMGGDSTMARWYNGSPRLVGGDLIHPSPQGGRIVAQIFVHQLYGGFNRFKAKQYANSRTAGEQ